VPEMRTWKKVMLVLPLVIFIICLFWVTDYLNRYDKEYYDTVFDEQIDRVNHVVEAVDSLKSAGVNYQYGSEIYNTLVLHEMERMNSEPGISACVITLGFDYITPEGTNPDLEKLFEIGNTEKSKLLDEMQKSATGEITVESDETPMKIYWREMPTINPGYYVVVGVDNHQILRNVNVMPLKIFTFIISIVTLVSIYDSLFLRMKHEGAEK